MTTVKHNPENERIKHRYFAYLREAHGYSESTVDAVAKALDRFEDNTKRRDFGAFHYQQATSFKRDLAEQRNLQTGMPLSKATQHATMGHLRHFFIWLADQPGFRSRIKYSDAEYFNLSDKDSRIATARRDPKGPTIEQVKHVLGCMPVMTDIERRNRALIAFTLLTGARDQAMASMKMKHVDLTNRSVFQDAREVRTKNSKTFRTWFFPVGDDILAIVMEWVVHLRRECLWGEDDPLFPATRIEVGASQRFTPAGLARNHWTTTTPIRAIFRAAFERAGLPYFNPHSFRNTLVRFGMDRCRSPEEFKAWSQNLGHEGVMTTFRSYGDVPAGRQSELLQRLGASVLSKTPAEELADVLMKKIGEQLGLKGSRFGDTL
jgi:site-specific recombinase XerD